jgi:hypothetical protein
MTIVMSKTELLATLDKVLERAKREDDRIAKKHQADEQAALEKFRKRLREVLNWNWHKVKEIGYAELRPDKPSCPFLQSPHIERAIRELKLDKRKNEQMNIAPGSDIHAALTWLPESERAKKTVCD